MWVRFAIKLQRRTVEGDLGDAAPAALDPITQFDRPLQHDGFDAQTIEGGRYDGVDPQHAGFSTDAQETPDDQAEGNTCATGIDTPAPVERYRVAPDEPVLLARLVSIRERCIRARVVAVGLAQSGAGHDRANSDRVRLAQGMEEALSLSNMRESLCVTQMGMHVHQADLTAEECCSFRALEQALQAPVIGHRAIEEADAVGHAQVLVYQSQVLSSLRRGQHVFQDRVDHRERAVAYAGCLIARVQQVSRRLAVFE